MSLTLLAQMDKQLFLDGNSLGNKIFSDTLEQKIWIEQKLTELWASGHIFSGVDSITSGAIYLHQGEKFQGRINRILLFDGQSKIYDTLSPPKSKQLSFPTVWLDEYINNGYPFAQVRVDSIAVTEHTCEMLLSIDPGPEITYDTLALTSRVKVNRSFLSKTLDMPPGGRFSEKSFRQISARLARVSFLELNKRPDVGFSQGKATIYLDLKQNATNSFEGILGLQPNQSAQENLVVTGYIDLLLANLFQSGKKVNFTWNRFADQSQSLDINYHHPYFLSSRILFDAGFSLIKQDTTFLTQTWRLGAGSYLADHLEVLFNYEHINGALIEPDASNLRAGFADYRTHLYAVTLQHPLYPVHLGLGNQFRFFGKLGVGDKEIAINSAIGSEGYDTLSRQTLFANLTVGVKYQFVLRKRTTIHHQVTGGGLFNDEILKNELFRLGGLQTIRGFNEKFFFARQFALSRLELRQYFEERSYFMVFYDQLVYAQEEIWDTPAGFGAGLALQTSNGLFSFAMALGTSENVPVDPSNIKIHLGYISRF